MMETRLDAKQKAVVRSSFEDHPLLLMCDDTFTQYQRQLRQLRLEPVEVFCESAEIVDALLEDRQSCDSLLRTLWDKLVIRMGDWAPLAQDEELDTAVGCIYMAAVAALASSADTRHSYTLVRKLLSDMHKHFADYQKLEDVVIPSLDYHQQVLQKWITDYIGSEVYLSDEIEEVISRKKRGGGSTGSPTGRGGMVCEVDPSADSGTEFVPDRATFIKKGILDSQLAIVQNEIYKSGWLVHDRPDDFCALFSGKQNSITIVWRKGVGKGNLCALFDMMLKGRYIECPAGHTYQKMLKSHFVDEDGNYLTGLNSTYVPEKCQIVLDTCKHHLDLQMPGTC